MLILTTGRKIDNGTESRGCYSTQVKLVESIRIAQDMTSYPKVERRLHAREFVLKDATIVADQLRIACSVRNQHEHGAELRVDPNVLIPERFLLDVPADGTTYRAVARWRRNERLGVQLYVNAMRLT